MNTLYRFSFLKRTGLAGAFLCLTAVSSAWGQTKPDYQRASTVASYSEGCLITVCGEVANRQRAVDTDDVSAAEVTSPLALTTASLRLHFPAAAVPGEQARVALSSQAGLNLSSLSNVRIRTYLGNSTSAQQDMSAGSLLTVAAANDEVSLFSFPVTAAFDELEVRVQGAVTASYTVRVHYAQTTLPAPLPVSLISFTGNASGRGVDLNWQTASEQQASHFVVERSATGYAPFEALGEVQSRGNSNQRQAYQFRDAGAAAQAAPALYYRLRQVDVDGKATLSSVVAVTTSKHPSLTQIQVYPSPSAAGAALQLSWAAPGQSGPQVVLYDNRGALLYQAAATQPGQAFQPPVLAAGLYLAVLLNAQGQRLAQHRFTIDQAR